MTDQPRRQPPEDPTPASASRWWEDPPPPSAASGSDSLGDDDPLGPGFDAGGRHCLELCPICRGAELLRAGGSPELRGQLDDFGREALLTLRSLIDHYLERTDAAADPSKRVEEIPID